MKLAITSLRRSHWLARAVIVALVATALLTVPGVAQAQCASQPACPNPCTMCRTLPAAGTNPTVATMSSLFDQIAAGPAVYGTLGWDFGTRATFGAGPGWCGGAGARLTVPAHFPCLILKAIYLTESSWRQFCDSGRTVVAFDCGYGIAQVTSGMRRGDTSAFDPDRVASSAAYNVSVGAAILADKWRASACIGANDPDVIEDWYFSVWGYNGFVFRNNPNNPMFAAARPEFRTPGIASAQTRGNYPYPELVWGYAHYPLTAAHYTGIGLAYPVRSEICASCGFPTANISEPVGAHRATCPGGPMPDAGQADVVTASDVATADVVTSDIVIAPDVQSPPDAGETDTGETVDVVSSTDAGSNRDTGGIGAETTTPGTCGCAVPGHANGHGRMLALTGLLFVTALGRRRRTRV